MTLATFYELRGASGRPLLHCNYGDFHLAAGDALMMASATGEHVEVWKIRKNGKQSERVATAIGQTGDRL